MEVSLALIEWLLGGVLALVVVVIGGAWSIHKHLNQQMILRQSLVESTRSVSERQYAESARRDAELSERITAIRLELFQQLNNYVTRAELDKRMEKFEQSQDRITEKLDAVLFRLKE